MPPNSVIVATYDSANLPAYCIDVILSQPVNDLKIIVVRDGSTDKTKIEKPLDYFIIQYVDRLEHKALKTLLVNCFL